MNAGQSIEFFFLQYIFDHLSQNLSNTLTITVNLFFFFLQKL